MIDTKKRRTAIACDKCKKRKKKCGGTLPSCSSCQADGSTCVYSDSHLQGYHKYMQKQIVRLDELQSSVNHMMREIDDIRHSLQSPENYKENFAEQSQKAQFVDPILNLVQKPHKESVYIGPSAIISKVEAIRKILTNDRAIDVSKTPLHRIQHSLSETSTLSPTKQSEDLYIQCYLTFSSHRYHFVERNNVEELYKKPALERSSWEKFVVAVCLANGARIAELSKLSIQASPQYYFQQSLNLLSQLPVLSPMKQIQVCMCLALYLTYAYDRSNPFAVNTWELSGIAVRKMFQHGYHKKKTPTIENAVQTELEKRLFWSVYAFDRLLSISVGRPYSISDAEIDVAFPLSLKIIDPNDAMTIYKLQMDQLTKSDFSLPVTPITYLIETCKVRDLDGRINVFAYGKRKDDATFDKEFEEINQALEDWIGQIPTRKEFDEGLNREVPFEYLLLLYHRSKLFLLLPKITQQRKIPPLENQSILSQLLNAAGGICKAFRRIHKDALFGYSIFSLHTIFLAGVTLVYCVWALGNPPHIKAHNDIRACSNLLYAFSERTQEAETYRVLFESLIENILFNADVEVERSPKLIPSEPDFEPFDENKLFTFTFDDDFWAKLLQ